MTDETAIVAAAAAAAAVKTKSRVVISRFFRQISSE